MHTNHRTRKLTFTTCTSNLTLSGFDESSKTGAFSSTVGGRSPLSSTGDAAKSRGMGGTNLLLVGEAERDTEVDMDPLPFP